MKSNVKLHRILNDRYVHSCMVNIAVQIKSFKQEFLTFVVILNGGIYTAYSILKMFNSKDLDLIIKHLGLSSYDERTSSGGEVMITLPLTNLSRDIEDRDVWIIDDVIGTGATLNKAVEIVQANNPKSIHTAVLVDKINNRLKHHQSEPDVVGYTYEGDKFLVGCGMNHGERYRQLNCLYELEIENEG